MTAQTLILNSWYMPHNIIPWQEAVTLLYLGKIEVVSEYEDVIASPSIAIRAPAVVRLKRFKGSHRKGVKFSRHNVHVRDNFTCAYCGFKGGRRSLNFDHVLPRSRGGKTTWENIVSSCIPCNGKKRNRTPEEAGMKLIYQPVRPKALGIAVPDPGDAPVPAAWEPFLSRAA